MDNEYYDENGGHGYVEHAAIGNAIVHVFYANEEERNVCDNDEEDTRKH